MKRIGKTPILLLAGLAVAGWTGTGPVLMELHVFAGGSDGGIPYAGLTYWRGALYGVTDIGGTGDCGGSGCGTVFKLTRPVVPGAAWTKTVLYNFVGGAGDGASPQAAPVFGRNGEMYGTTAAGGKGLGTVYELTPPAPGGTAWTEQVLQKFTGARTGASPNGALLLDNAGALYGTAEAGGKDYAGVVFQVSPPAPGATAWTTTVLYHFSGGNDGSGPLGGLTVGPWGVLYGTTESGGKNQDGTVFSLTPPATIGGAWQQAVLHDFAGGTDGAAPLAALVADDTGALYGTTAEGGGAVCAEESGCGTVFRLRPPVDGRRAWQESVLHAFAGNDDGAYANSPLSINENGVVYGATLVGGGTACGGSGCGTLFSLTPPPSGGVAWTETVLHRFAGGSDGAYPQAPILPGRQAVLFGSTAVGPLGDCGSPGFPEGCGTLFKMRLAP